jgi:hypothetical protein
VETRARRRLGLPTELASEDGYAAVEERLSPRAALAEALDTLPEHEREAIELRVVGELPYPDVAARLGVRPAAARLRVSRGAPAPFRPAPQGEHMNASPPGLDHFGAELENAVGRDLRIRRTRRRMVRGAAVLAVVAAAALGLLSGLTGGGPSVVQRAAAALQSSDDSILHYQFDATQQNGDGSVATWNQETWQLRVAPYTRRQIAVDGTDGIRAEPVSSGDTNELYDSRTDTIYIATNQELLAARMPDITIVSEQARQAHR